VAADGAPERRRWLDQLPGMVPALASRWSLELDAPYQPGGQCSWVAPPRGPCGERLVLEVGGLIPRRCGKLTLCGFGMGTGPLRSMPSA
jgi:hypothetical protein